MNNILYNGIVIDPSEFLMPKIRISPFNQADFITPLDDDTSTVDLTTYKEFYGKHLYLGVKARQLIEYALSLCNLKPEDVVTILTTSGNLYVSNCITREIEKFCKWSRVLSDKTKVIIVNHEFGYAYPNVAELKKYNVPIIEDCAQSFFTDNRKIGKHGDYTIYSLPKAFPMQIGAILASKKPVKYEIEKGKKEYINAKLAKYLPQSEDIKAKRLENYTYLKDNLKEMEIEPFFELPSNTYPGVFLFKWLECINYQKLKDFMASNGIECSVFYGKNAFFIPLHHNLKKTELDYMITLLHYFHQNMI